MLTFGKRNLLDNIGILRMNFKSILFFLIFFPLVTLANTNPSQYIVGVDLGLAKPTNISGSTFPLGYSTFSYGSNTNDIRALISGISISKLFTINQLNSFQIGLSAHYIPNMNVQGSLEQGISPPFFQSTYSYSINSYQYLLDAKLRWQFYNRFFPYIYLGVGVASNRAHSFSTAVPAYLTVTPQYSNNTTTSFAYSTGLGVDYFVLSKLSVGIGYRFINLGKVGLGSGVIRNTNVAAKLTQSNLYLNTFLAQLNYFI
jgi:opacity protein-like surface antigen